MKARSNSIEPEARPQAAARRGRGVRLIATLRDVVLILLAAAVLTELCLRVYNPIYVPLRADRIELPVNRVFTGRVLNNKKVDPVQVTTYNGIGLRGPEYPAQPERFIKIFTVGGSATACVALSDGRTWPDVLLRRLSQGRSDVWLNNAGLDGHSTFGHLVLLDSHLRKYRPDYIVYLVGVNDAGRSDLSQFDAGLTGGGASWRNRIVAASELLATAQVLYRSLRAFDLGLNHDYAHDLTTMPRLPAPTAEQRSAELARHRSEFLGAYRQRLEALLAKTREIGAVPVFVTQPGLIGSGVDPATGVEIGTLQYLGPLTAGLQTRGPLTAGLQWEVLELYHDVLRQLAAERGVLLVDAARQMPKDSALYYDWYHYSIEGAQRMGEIVAAGLAPQLRAP
jgi:lysophospholipase L1-like esterase